MAKVRLNFKTLKTLYLYADGHAVLCHEQLEHRSGTTLRWVEIVEKFGPKCHFQGRVIFGRVYDFSRGIVSLVQKAYSVTASVPCLDHGSEQSKARGIMVGTLDIRGKDFSIHLNELPQLFCGEYDYQPDADEKWETLDVSNWGGYNIAKRYAE